MRFHHGRTGRGEETCFSSTRSVRGHCLRTPHRLASSPVTHATCIAVLGERIIDLVPSSDGRDFRAIPGGSPANVALALARLGIEPLLLARRASDGFAELLDANLRASGLSMEGVVDGGGVSMLAVCTRNPDSSMSYSFYTSDSPDLRWSAADLDRARQAIADRGAVAWHTGSLASYLGDGVEALLAEWRRARTEGVLTLSYDPNARPMALESDRMRERVEQFAVTAHVVKASDEDLAYCYPDATPEQVCARWVEEGPVIVVLTRGARGVTVFQRGRPPRDHAAVTVDVVDTVGAGDTLTAGLLAGLSPWCGPRSEQRLAELDADIVDDVVSRAIIAAAITCSRPGADPPTHDEVQGMRAGQR